MLLSMLLSMLPASSTCGSCASSSDSSYKAVSISARGSKYFASAIATAAHALKEMIH